MGLDSLSTSADFALLLGLVDGQALPFFFFHSLDFGLLTLVQVSVVVLLSLHETELLLFEDFHAGALECLPADDAEEWLNFVVEDEKFVILDESFFANASDFGHAVSGRGPLDFEGGLATNFVNGRFISQFRYKLVSLDINILLARWRLGSLHVPGEELLSGLCTLLLHGFGVVFGLVGVKQFVGVGPGRDDHGGVSRSAVDTLVVHDVVGGVVLGRDMAVRVLIL